MKINILFASLSVVALCASCSTGKSSGTEEEQVAEQTTQTEEETQVVSQKLDEVAEVEKKAPEERTLRDDLVIVCHAPEKVSEEMEQDERTRKNVYRVNPSANRILHGTGTSQLL